MACLMAFAVAESTLTLLDRIAADLAACRDPWARHWLVLPGSGRSEWLLRRWARRAGDAAHSHVVPLRSVIEQVASVGGEPFSRERLVLAVAQALATLANRIPLAANADCAVVNAQVLGWARQLADAIDLTLLCREGERRWMHSPFLAEVCEHASVKSVISTHLGSLDQQEFRIAVSHWAERWHHRGGVPRLWIQLDAGLPRVLMRCLSSMVDLLGDRVHLSLWCPSLSFWGDLHVSRKFTTEADAGPVLTPLGRAAQDLHKQSIEYFISEGSGGEELSTPRPANSLLGELQNTCRSARAPLGKALVRADDWSLTVHACRNPLRELEVCRDRILQALAEDPSLRDEDVLVLLADPIAYSHLVGAALAPLSVRLVGAASALLSPVATGLLRLLRTLDGRLGLADLQYLMDEPLVAEKFGFTGIAAELLGWLEEAQFHWGIDARQRAELQGDGERRWNLGFALRRLALGAVVSTGGPPLVVDGDVPLERASGLGTAPLAALARFAALLYDARTAWSGSARNGHHHAARPMSAWCELLTRWCDGFLAEGTGATSEQRTQLLNTLIPNLERAAPEGLLVGGDAVLRLLEASLESLQATHGSSAGGLTVGDLRQHAGTPPRMGLVAGLGSESFPHHDDRPSWHPLATSRECGDPDRREADRHALLLALVSATDRVVLTYRGGSDEDTRERPPSAPVADLLAAVDAVATLPGGESVTNTILLKHGLNGFSPGSCAADSQPVARSQLASDYLGAAALVSADRGDYPGLWSQCLPALAQRNAMAGRDLQDVLQEPCRVFVRRLGLRIPEEPPELSHADKREPAPLARGSFGPRLLQCRRTGESEDRLIEQLRISGECPRGQYGEALRKQLLDELPEIHQQGLRPMTEPIRFEYEGRSFDVALPEGWFQSNDGSVVYCCASARNRSRLLRLSISLLCLAYAEGVRQVDVWFSKDTKAQVLRAPEPGRAAELLSELCRLHELAQCIALPVWPEAYDRMRGLQERLGRTEAEVDPTLLLNAAWSTWAQGTNRGAAMPPESSLAATRLCFRGLDDPFAWAPSVNVPWLPAEGAPLAWRLYCFVSKWETAARGEP